MESINLNEILSAKVSNMLLNTPSWSKTLLFNAMQKLFHLEQVQDFIQNNKFLKNYEFIDSLFDKLNFSYYVSNCDFKKIPSEGKLVVVANHPLGGLDGLALLRAISEVRQDVKILVNDILMNIDNLKDLFLPFDLYSKKNHKSNIEQIEKCLSNDEAVIFFPAGEVSRMTIRGLRDNKWNKGALNMAKKFAAPILPVYIEGRNSLLFYLISSIYKTAATFLLPHELFNKQHTTISFLIGDPIPARSFQGVTTNIKQVVKLMRKHLYNIGKGKSTIFATEKTIAHPTPIRLVKTEFEKANQLGTTKDGKAIYLCTADTCPNIMKEIARLREITFRLVGEGTGKALDTDIYDSYYKHLVLWDEDNLEIVGAYRMGITREILDNHGTLGLYNSSQFIFDSEFTNNFSESIELGRSFIQQKYWKSSALDYMWQGIGAYLNTNPAVRYLWGAVSISDSYSDFAKSMIVYYYKKWYQGDAALAKPFKSFIMSKNSLEQLDMIFLGTTPEEDYKTLKFNLKELGFSVPVLYKRYTDICEYGGAKFIDFSIDENFSNSVDGLVLLDLHQMKKEYKDRYYGTKSLNLETVIEG